MMKRLLSASALAALLLCGVGQLKAGTILLDLEDSPTAYDSSYSITFGVSQSSTTVEFAGYQVPSSEQVFDISLTSIGGSSNLLGQTWSFTPAPSGSSAGQYDDGYGTGTNAVSFAGTTEDSFDRFDQAISTTPGQLYTLSFNFHNNNGPPNELLVWTFASPSATPEPASLTLLGLGGLGLAGYGWRRRRLALTA